MPANLVKHLLVAPMLMAAAMSASALTTSPNTFSESDLQVMLAQSQPAQPAQSAQSAQQTSPAPLTVGLSDPQTKLVLPWFLAELVDAVNQHTAPQDVVKKLRKGI
ncbi:hypothetical protein R82526_03197 [Ralstonia mannitolilytica]|jgi:hypothetical protein|uniref:hypothetical protein n=1 Tax=Ralstonia mannitolilytica TaxID=105219 RepID=UPI0007B022C9|nr:hypothetical protein [Ralstonia mannitolilytica]ANA35541.1 hypothetical protein VZ52_19140 [Ralstonia mannitolilytica]CAJ0688702.1 hypothetical protein R82526_03197 [Ralstonia mannitolilytica]CAJ0862760.1 hypothetical protein R76727_01664 [Ralstonia mannitolilytica]